MRFITRLREAVAASSEPQLQRAGVADPDDEYREAGTADDEMREADFTADDRKKLADKGQAMPDGSFPIRNKSDLSNAISAYGRAKDKAAAKSHIIKRAKALGAAGSLPDDWNVKESAAPERLHGLLRLREVAPAVITLPDGTVRYEVTIVGEGLGNAEDRNYYTKDALREAVAAGLFDGLKAYADHPSKQDQDDLPERSVRDVVGHYHDARYVEVGGVGKVRAEFEPVQGDGYGWVGSLVESAIRASENGTATDLVGISVNGLGVMEPGVLPDGEFGNWVRQLAVIPSADIVTTPGAGGTFIRRITESLRHAPPSQATTPKESSMKPAELQEKLGKLHGRLREAGKLPEGDEANKAVADVLGEIDELTKVQLEPIREATPEPPKPDPKADEADDADDGDRIKTLEGRVREAETAREKAEADKAKAESERDDANGKVQGYDKSLAGMKLLREADGVSQKLAELWLPELVACDDEDAMKARLKSKLAERDLMVEHVREASWGRVEGAGRRQPTVPAAPAKSIEDDLGIPEGDLQPAEAAAE
jgi:hypothetical protein